MPTLPKGKNRNWIIKSKPLERQINNSSFYNSKSWRMTRSLYIKKNALCEQCKRDGFITSSQMVDHIKPMSLGGMALDISNLQALCNKCHAKKSSREGLEYRKGIKEYKKIKKI